MTIRTAIMPVALLLGIVCGGNVARAQDPPPPPTIVASGEATVSRAPDQAFITVLVETRAPQPRDAQQRNSAAMTSVQQRLTALSIPKDAIRTTGYNIQQEFDFRDGRRIPREYVARNGVEVRLDAVDRTGEVLEAVVQAGATNIGGVRFDIKDRAQVEREALRHAVEDARARADAMAAGAGRQVDRVIRIDDGQPAPTPYPTAMAMRTAQAAGGAPPIESGVIEVRARVTLTVTIK